MNFLSRLIILIVLLPFTSDGQTIIEAYRNDVKEHHSLVYLYGSNRTFAFGYLIPTCTWDEIKDTLCRVEIEINGKRYSFGLLHVSDLAKAATLSFRLNDKGTSVPKVVHYGQYTTEIIGSREKIADENCNELLIIE